MHEEVPFQIRILYFLYLWLLFKINVIKLGKDII